jgi:hypothetical protein
MFMASQIENAISIHTNRSESVVDVTTPEQVDAGKVVFGIEKAIRKEDGYDTEIVLLGDYLKSLED